LEDVERWFSTHFKKRKPLSPITRASIAGKIEWLARYPPQDKIPEPETSPAGKHARLLLKHLPPVISLQGEQAALEDERNRDPGSSAHWMTVSLLKNLAQSVDLLMPILDPTHTRRTPWHLQAAWIDDIIVSSIRLHADEKASRFSRSSDRPFVAMIADILEKIGAGSHSPGAVADALSNVPGRERLVIRVGGVPAPTGTVS
jgi:hypothetical protein